MTAVDREFFVLRNVCILALLYDQRSLQMEHICDFYLLMVNFSNVILLEIIANIFVVVSKKTNFVIHCLRPIS